VSNYRHHQPWTPADAYGRSLPGQAWCGAGSPHRYLASDEETAGSIRPPRRGFPPANLFSHRLPNLMVMSDSGSRMGATMSAQVRLDAVIVAAGRFLVSPDNPVLRASSGPYRRDCSSAERLRARRPQPEDGNGAGRPFSSVSDLVAE